MSIESDKDEPRQLTSEFIPDAMVFSVNGQDQNREVHSARANMKRCPKCGMENAEIWEFKLHPLTQFPNYLMVHRGPDSCGIRYGMIDPLDYDGWVIKD